MSLSWTSLPKSPPEGEESQVRLIVASPLGLIEVELAAMAVLSIVTELKISFTLGEPASDNINVN